MGDAMCMDNIDDYMLEIVKKDATEDDVFDDMFEDLSKQNEGSDLVCMNSRSGHKSIVIKNRSCKIKHVSWVFGGEETQDDELEHSVPKQFDTEFHRLFDLVN